MNQTIVIGHNSTFPKKTNKIAWIINGMIFMTLGISELYRSPNEKLSLTLAILLLLGGLYSILYAFLGLSKTSKFALKIILTNEIISIKKSFWKAAIEIKWSDITSIDFHPYQINFSLTNEINTFDYETNAETSIEIKKSIRQFAESKNIKVIGG